MSETINAIKETGCCPFFHPEKMDGQELVFADKLFLKDHINSFFYIPLNYGKVMEKNFALIEKNHAMPKEQLVLSGETSMWRSDVYIAIDKAIAGAQLTKLPGTFLAKVFQGSYKRMGSFIDSMKAYVKSRGKEMRKMYFYYPYCPKCAKTYGKNYVVIFAKV